MGWKRECAGRQYFHLLIASSTGLRKMMVKCVREGYRCGRDGWYGCSVGQSDGIVWNRHARCTRWCTLHIACGRSVHCGGTAYCADCWDEQALWEFDERAQWRGGFNKNRGCALWWSWQRVVAQRTTRQRSNIRSVLLVVCSRLCQCCPLWKWKIIISCSNCSNWLGFICKLVKFGPKFSKKGISALFWSRWILSSFYNFDCNNQKILNLLTKN